MTPFKTSQVAIKDITSRSEQTNNNRGAMFMENVSILKQGEGTKRIIVCDLEAFLWLELEDGTILVDFKYLEQLKLECAD